MVTQADVAKALGIHQATVSKVYSGRCGKKVAQKISAITKRPWHEYLAMAGHEIRAELEAALAGSTDQAGAA